MAQYGGGVACYLLQYRRALFILLHDVWGVVTGDVPRSLRWKVIVSEFLGVLLGLPLCFIDFRQFTSSVVHCTDASEQGVAVCVASSLTTQGEEMLTRKLSAMPGLFENMIGIHKSFAGIGGLRRALEILGIVPAVHTACEIDEYAVNVLRSRYPAVKMLGDIRRVTPDAFRAFAADQPMMTLVIHGAGSPCPGFCAWNPFAPGNQHSESVELMDQVRRVTKCLQEGYSECTVKEFEENVASMSKGDSMSISERLGVVPVRADAADLCHQRRRRY